MELLKKGKIPKPNLDKEERIALNQLRKDKDRVILTADKGCHNGSVRQGRLHQQGQGFT